MVWIFYEDGKQERVAAEMMGENGLLMPYSVFRTIKTTLVNAEDSLLPAGGTKVGIAEGSSNTKQHTRQIGLANETVRQLTMCIYFIICQCRKFSINFIITTNR